MQTKNFRITLRSGITTAALGMVPALTACDPVPPPECPDTTQYPVTSAWDGSVLTATFSSCVGNVCANWGNVEVSQLSGAVLEEVAKPSVSTLVVRIRPTGADASTMTDAGAGDLTGSFLLQAKVTDKEGMSCSNTTQRLRFSVRGSQSTVEYVAASLPLQRRSDVRLALISHHEGQLVLRAVSAEPGEVSWKVYAGESHIGADGQLQWMLPRRPGTFLAEVVVRFQDGSFGRDIIVAEVV